MAVSQSLGSVLIYGYTAAGVYYEPYLTETTDTSTNTSTLTIAHKIRVMSEWGSYYNIPNSTPIYVTIDGTTYSYTPGSMPNVPPDNTAVTAATTTHTVSHSSDGTKTISIKCQWNTSSASYYGYTSTQSITLTQIARASTMTLSSSSQTMGASYTFTISPSDSSFTHKITWSFGGSSGTAVSSIAAGTTTATYTPPIATFAPLCTTATSGTITYTLTTLSSGTSVGTKSYTATLSVPSSVVPTVSVSTTMVDGFNSQYLGGVSSVKMTATGSVSSDYSATIVSYKFALLNSSSTTVYSNTVSSTSTSANYSYVCPSAAGTYTCKVTITDSRGRTGSATATITVVAYSAPSWGSCTAYRSDSSGVSADEGTYVCLTANATYTAVSGNSLSMTYATKTASASSYGTAQTITSGTAEIISGFAITTAYNIKLTATDTVGNSITKVLYVSTSAVGIDYDPTNNNLGLLLYAPSTAAGDEVYMPTGYAYAPDGSTFSKLMTVTDDDAPSGTRKFQVPYLSYSAVGGTSSGVSVAANYQAWLKYICATYGSYIKSYRICEGLFVTGVIVHIQGFIYHATDLDSSTGLPQYSSFEVLPYHSSNVKYRFGTNNYTFYFDAEIKYAVPSNQYHYNSSYGISMNNSDIIGANGIFFNDAADAGGEGLQFYRDGTYWDALLAHDASIYFAPRSTSSALATQYAVPDARWVSHFRINASSTYSVRLEGNYGAFILLGFGAGIGTVVIAVNVNSGSIANVRNLLTNSAYSNSYLTFTWDSTNYAVVVANSYSSGYSYFTVISSPCSIMSVMT